MMLSTPADSVAIVIRMFVKLTHTTKGTASADDRMLKAEHPMLYALACYMAPGDRRVVGPFTIERMS
jgi:hypothetical protein